MKNNGLIWALVILIVFGVCIASNTRDGEKPDTECPMGQSYIAGKCR